MDIQTAQRKGKVVRILSWIFIGFFIVGLIGLVVSVVGAELSAEADAAIWWICAGVSFLVILIFIALTLLCFRLGEKYRTAEADARELADSPESFFVGEKMLASFTQEGLHIHAEAGAEGNLRDVTVPYCDVTFYSVRMRTSPRAAGQKTVLLEIPARYLEADAPDKAQPSLISMDAKERLFRAIEAHGVPLIETDSGKRPEKLEKVYAVKLRQSGGKGKYISAVLAGAMILAGILLAVFGGAASSLGYLLAVFGACSAARSIYDFARGDGSLIVYRQGVYWKERNLYESVYLPWEEIGGVTRTEQEGHSFVRFACAYGAFYYPDIDGLYDAIAQEFPEKAGREAA